MYSRRRTHTLKKSYCSKTFGTKKIIYILDKDKATQTMGIRRVCGKKKESKIDIEMGFQSFGYKR